MPRRVFRYPGLVRTMQEVRRAIQSPLTQEEARALETRVRDFLEDVRVAAGEAGLTVRSLSPTSRRAFEYLEAFDPARMKVATRASGASPPTTVRIANIVARRDRFLRRFRRLVRDYSGTSASDLKSEIGDTTSEIAIHCERAGVTPAALPGPSRRAYQWMSFLAEGDNLERHVHSQSFASRIDARVQVDLYHLDALYRFVWKRDAVLLTLSEAFVDAPAAVLTAAVKVALPYTHKRRHRSLLRSHASSPAFEDRLLELETAGGSFAEHTHGLVYDLEAVFDSVNTHMFRGRLRRPRLSWLATTSLREFGHFVSAMDLVLISSQLDSPDVPAFVVEHVVHHELLHRELGSKAAGGRRIFHTATFRRRERQFPRFAEADAFLQRMARG